MEYLETAREVVDPIKLLVAEELFRKNKEGNTYEEPAFGCSCGNAFISAAVIADPVIKISGVIALRNEEGAWQLSLDEFKELPQTEFL